MAARSFDQVLNAYPLASIASAQATLWEHSAHSPSPARADQFEGQFGNAGAHRGRAAKGSAPKAGLSRLLKERVHTHRFAGGRRFSPDMAGLRQRATVKIHYFNHAKGGGGALKAHAQYLRRDAAGREEPELNDDAPSLEPEIDTSEKDVRAHAKYLARGERGRDVFYDSLEDGIDGGVRAAAWAKSDKRHFRIILSPEAGEQIRDLPSYTREVMARAEAELGTRLHWIAIDHHDTAHTHTHIILRGRRANGQDLIIPKDLIQHGFRNIARDVATEWLGRRTRSQEREALEREALRHAPTRLDRIIAVQLPEDRTIHISHLEALDGDRTVTKELKTRARELKAMGLADEISRGVLTFTVDWQDRLKSMELHLDIRRNLMNERRLEQQRLERERLTRKLSLGPDR